jgi:hypothetical protein
MEQINKLETIFSSGSLTEQLNSLEASLLRGGTLPGCPGCDNGPCCQEGNSIFDTTCVRGSLCADGGGCEAGGK